MKSNSYKLPSNLDEGLRKYAESNNLSPISIINELVEDFLIKENVLTIPLVISEKEEPAPVEKIKHASYSPSKGSYQIRKRVGKMDYGYGTVHHAGLAKELVKFLESENWDVKYSTNETKLNGVKQINFLLKEMKKKEEK